MKNMAGLKKTLACLISLSISIQLITGCAAQKNNDTSNVLLTENFVEEVFFDESLYEEQITQQTFAMEHLYYQDDSYEYKVEEAIIGEAYTIELVVGENTADELGAMLPEELANYDVDWSKVIGKFAVGTSIIIATGIIYPYLPKSTYFVFASPLKVAREAVIGAAFASAFELGIKYIEKGDLPSDVIKKYAIEGAADGYMWGAIFAVVEPFAVPKSLKLQGGEKLKIALDGSVKNAAGEIIGKAYQGRKGIYVLENIAGKTATKLFSKTGKETVEASAEQLARIAGGKLPPNAVLQLASEASGQICKTDAEGIIYMVDGKLLPNITYTLGGNVYKTDSLGRIAKASFQQLELKEAGTKRRVTVDSIQDIGRGFQRVDDQRGHIIADRFKGANTLANMVPMSPNANQMEYKAIENTWATAIANGKSVNGEIVFEYSGDSFRPDRFSVMYDIGDGAVKTIISNL